MRSLTVLVTVYVLVLMPVVSSAQKDFRTVKCRIVAEPVGVEFYENLSYGAGLKARYHFSGRFFVQGSIFFAAADHLDAFRKHASEQVLSSDVRLPRYNQTNVSAGYYFLKGHRSTGIASESSEFTRDVSRYAGIRGGYSYYQHATASYNMDYWIVDTMSSGERLSLSGVMVHSGFIGIDLLSLSDKTQPLETERREFHQHHLYVDALYGFLLKTAGMRTDADGTVHPQDVGRSFGLHAFGGRIGYAYTHTVSRHLGYSLGCEVSFRPRIDYSANQMFYTPRGGEGIEPLGMSLKLGVSWN